MDDVREVLLRSGREMDAKEPWIACAEQCYAGQLPGPHRGGAALAATGYRQVLGGIAAEPGAEKLRPLRPRADIVHATAAKLPPPPGHHHRHTQLPQPLQLCAHRAPGADVVPIGPGADPQPACVSMGSAHGPQCATVGCIVQATTEASGRSFCRGPVVCVPV
eukprot:364365-Chlamydomonas_euryale.AAC.14